VNQDLPAPGGACGVEHCDDRAGKSNETGLHNEATSFLPTRKLQSECPRKAQLKGVSPLRWGRVDEKGARAKRGSPAHPCYFATRSSERINPNGGLPVKA
jgi:hypothetical protein